MFDWRDKEALHFSDSFDTTTTNTKKHRDPQAIALSPILKHIGKTHHFNENFKNQLYSKKSFPLEVLANTKNTDINRQLHSSPFAKT